MRSSAVVFVLAASLAVAGCAGGAPADPGTSSPAATESTSPNASPSPTATPSAPYKPADASGPAQNVPVPVLPEVAKTETKEGAEAFAKYWFNMLSYSYETGDVSNFESLEPPSCVACQTVKEVIVSWHSDGRWLVGGKLSTPVTNTTFVKGQDGRYQVAVQVHQEPLSYMRADGTVARTDPPAPDQGNLLFLAYENGAWSAVELGSIVG
ncbi:DUF6318 family protein [Pseudarthrobacter sp. NS4]|uniref:DUF6318 family protein n=1 Tax=Pseudarthrobacter sp. NS4 TaxID=2973976 RepID=UPI0037C97C17